jgi:hypothetical protein
MGTKWFTWIQSVLHECNFVTLLLLSNTLPHLKRLYLHITNPLCSPVMRKEHIHCFLCLIASNRNSIYFLLFSIKRICRDIIHDRKSFPCSKVNNFTHTAMHTLTHTLSLSHTHKYTHHTTHHPPTRTLTLHSHIHTHSQLHTQAHSRPRLPWHTYTNPRTCPHCHTNI